MHFIETTRTINMQENWLCMLLQRTIFSKTYIKISCENVIYFNLGSDIIKENCNFAYYFNKTDIKPTALDGRNEVILANWPDDTHSVNVNNGIPVKIPTFPYVLVNQSVLCCCGIEVENNFLLESLAACHMQNPN